MIKAKYEQYNLIKADYGKYDFMLADIKIGVFNIKKVKQVRRLV